MRTRQQKKKDSAEKERQKELNEEKAEMRRTIMEFLNEKRDDDRSIAKIDVVEEFNRLLELAISERVRFEAQRTSGGELSDFQVNPEVEMFLPRIRREVDESIQRRARSQNQMPTRPKAASGRGRKRARSPKPGATNAHVREEQNEADGSDLEEAEEMDEDNDEGQGSLQLNKTIGQIMENGFDLKALLLSLLPLIDQAPTSGVHQGNVQPKETIRRFGHRQDQIQEAETLIGRSSRNSLAQKGNQPGSGAKKANDVVMSEKKDMARRTSRRDSLIESLRKSVQRDPELRRELESLLDSSTTTRPEVAISRKRVSTPDVIFLKEDVVKKPRRHVDNLDTIFCIINCDLRNAPSVDQIDLLLALHSIGLQNVREVDVVPQDTVILPCRGELRHCVNFRVVRGEVSEQLEKMLADEHRAEKADIQNGKVFGPNTQSFVFLATKIGPVEAAEAVFLRALCFGLGRAGLFSAVFFEPRALEVTERNGRRSRRSLREWLTSEFRIPCNEALQALTFAGRQLLKESLRDVVAESFWF